MFSSWFLRSSVPFLAILILELAVPGRASAAACVWKVTGPKGGTLYLGGSVHGLRTTDYPLPSAYNRAFDASSRLVIEDDPNVSASALKSFFKSGQYAKGDNLKNHVDPRVYDYLRRVFAEQGVPEPNLAKLRPWMLIIMLWAPSTNQLGIEGFLLQRARANQKPVSGLESFREHFAIISGLSDQQAQLVLLLNFIPSSSDAGMHHRMLEAWRHGDVDALARWDREGLKDLPSLYERLINQRNRNWIPKIERDLQSGQIYFVVAGAAHMGGPNGVLALLRNDGCRIEPL